MGFFACIFLFMDNIVYILQLTMVNWHALLLTATTFSWRQTNAVCSRQ